MFYLVALSVSVFCFLFTVVWFPLVLQRFFVEFYGCVSSDFVVLHVLHISFTGDFPRAFLLFRMVFVVSDNLLLPSVSSLQVRTRFEFQTWPE